MPAAQFISSEGFSGVLNLRRSPTSKPSRKGETKWRKKFVVLKQNTLHLYEGHDENGKGENESHTVYLSKYKECTPIVDKKGRKKPGFTLVPNDSTYEQWMLSCEDNNQQEKWINQLNSAISGNIIVINFNLDEIKVQSPSLKHLSKTRPKCKGRRAPSKRPRMDSTEGNGDVWSEDSESGVTSVDAGSSAKKSRPNVTTGTSPVKSPEESKASAAKAFFKGISLKVSSALSRQKSVGAKTPQSPEPDGAKAMEVAPEDRMSLSTLLRTLQRIEDASGTIVNKAEALRVLFQGTHEDSLSLGRPALEVQNGLQCLTDTLEHLNLAEELQIKEKEDEERENMTKEETARFKREMEEAQRKQEEEEKAKGEVEEEEQRRRDEEEQELRDEEDRRKEEQRLEKEAAEQQAKEEALRLAKEAEAEEEKMWQSEGDGKPSQPQDGSQESSKVSKKEETATENGDVKMATDKQEDKQPDADKTSEAEQDTATTKEDYDETEGMDTKTEGQETLQDKMEVIDEHL